MANFASLLRDEILRLARKEVRNELEGIKKTSARYRSEIAELKRRVDRLEKNQNRPEKKSGKNPSLLESQESTTKIRFSARRLAAQRQKLGLTAAQMGALVGVSAQTIYNWEAERSRPRQAQLIAIAALRGMGKKQIKAGLEPLVGQDAKEG